MRSSKSPHPNSRFYPLDSYFETLSLPALFPEQQALEVEIGCGDGSFLVNYAEQHPERNFLGIERLLGRIRKLDRKAVRRGLTNLSIIRVEAGYGIQHLIPQGTVSAYHIYFPDPWPKRRHWKNRLIAPSLLDPLTRSLEPGGRIYLRTDNEDYFQQMLETMNGDPRFQAIEAPSSLTEVITDFEESFNVQGIPTLRAQYMLRPEARTSEPSAG